MEIRSFKVAQALMCSMDHFTRLLYLERHPLHWVLLDCEPCSGLKRVSDLHNKSVAFDFYRVASDSHCCEQTEQLAPDNFTTFSHTVPDLADSCDITHLKHKPSTKAVVVTRVLL